MSDQQTTLLRRVFAENRRAITGLGIALAANVLAYAFLVYPLSQRVANVTQRNDAAAKELAAARSENGLVMGTLTGKDRAAAELNTFYTSVLPQDLAGARRLTHLRIAQLARQHNLRYGRAASDPAAGQRNSTLTRLKIEMSLGGTYANMRSFIHSLETAPEFVVIDNVQLAESRENTDAIEVTLALSTYYRSGDAKP